MSSMTINGYPTHRVSRWRGLGHRFSEWQRRMRTRHELEWMSDATLRDIGVTRCDVHRELRKPFWMA